MTDATIKIGDGPEVPLNSPEAEREVGRLFDPTADDKAALVFSELRSAASEYRKKADRAWERAEKLNIAATKAEQALLAFRDLESTT